MTHTLDGRIGEAWAGEPPDGCHINVVLARRGSPTGAAAVAALASPRPGHTPFLVCLGPGTLVRPPTIFVNKTTVDSASIGRLTWGAAQLGVGQGVLDAVAEDLLEAREAPEMTVLAAVWIDPEATDESALRRACRAATRSAIADALDPGAVEAVRALVERREQAANGYYTGD